MEKYKTRDKPETKERQTRDLTRDKLLQQQQLILINTITTNSKKAWQAQFEQSSLSPYRYALKASFLMAQQGRHKHKYLIVSKQKEHS